MPLSDNGPGRVEQLKIAQDVVQSRGASTASNLLWIRVKFRAPSTMCHMEQARNRNHVWAECYHGAEEGRLPRSGVAAASFHPVLNSCAIFQCCVT